MLTAFNQNWHTTNLPYSLALANTVNTGGSFSTSSGAVRNSKIWASAGFRGLGPVLTFRGAGMDGMGCGCGCGGGCGGRAGRGLSGLTFDGTGVLGTGLFCWPPSADGSCSWGIAELILGAMGLYAVYSMFRQTKVFHTELEGAAQRRRKRRAAKYRQRAKALEEKPLGGIFS